MHKLIDFYQVICPNSGARPTFGNTRKKSLKMLNALGVDIYVTPRSKRELNPSDVPDISVYFDRWRFALTETRLSKFVVDGKLLPPNKTSELVNGKAKAGKVMQDFLDGHAKKYKFIIVDKYMLEPHKAIFNTGKFWFHISTGTHEDKITKMQMLSEESITKGATRFWSCRSIAKHLDLSGLRFAVDDKPVEWDGLRSFMIKLHEQMMLDGNFFPEVGRYTWGASMRQWMTDHRYPYGAPLEDLISFLNHGNHKLSIVDQDGETLYHVNSKFKAEEVGDVNRRSCTNGSSNQNGSSSLLEKAVHRKMRWF
ncbi:hypothetical protein SM033_00068 [Vibrio phage vB_VpaM_sm033]|nr:hypothetical protein SM033_00068 [Vibrio phage vB_VpaM_sm033]